MGHFGERVWVEKVVLKTTTARDWTGAPQEGSPAADLLRLIDEVSADDEAVASLLGEFSDLQKKLPPELGAGNEAGVLTAPWLRERLTEVKEDIVPQLLEDTL